MFVLTVLFFVVVYQIRGVLKLCEKNANSEAVELEYKEVCRNLWSLALGLMMFLVLWNESDCCIRNLLRNIHCDREGQRCRYGFSALCIEDGAHPFPPPFLSCMQSNALTVTLPTLAI